VVDGNLKYDQGRYYPLDQLQVPSSSRVGGVSLERLDTIESMSRTAALMCVCTCTSMS
jgi:hypothetical protein